MVAQNLELTENQKFPQIGENEQDHSDTLVIVATLNEEEGIGPTLTEMNDCLHNSFYLVVDGRSIDKTVKVAKATGAQVIFQKGSGKGDALATAIQHAKQLDVTYVVFTDADFTYPAEYVQDMIKILEDKPDIGMVCGNRFNNHVNLGRMHNILYTGNRVIALMHNLLNGVHLEDPLTGLRVVRWEVLRDWKPKSKGFDVEVELNYHVERKGYSIAEIPIHYRPRLGEKKLQIRHGLTIMQRIFTESLSSLNTF